MTVYVDNFRAPATVGRIKSRWSHLTADSPAELHEFADRLGLQRSWFQAKRGGRWHYDVTDGKRKQAIALGAQEVDLFEMAEIVSRPGRAEMIVAEGGTR